MDHENKPQQRCNQEYVHTRYTLQLSLKDLIQLSFWFLRINSICCAGVGVQTNNGQPGAGHCKLSKLSKWLQILDKPKLFIVLAAAADDKQGNIFLHDSRCSSDGRNAGPMLATNWGTGSHHGPSVTATVSVAWHWREFSNFDINVYRQYLEKVFK